MPFLLISLHFFISSPAGGVPSTGFEPTCSPPFVCMRQMSATTENGKEAHSLSFVFQRKMSNASTIVCSIETQTLSGIRKKQYMPQQIKSHADIRKQHDTHVAAITHMPAFQKPHTPHKPGIKKVPHLSTDVMLRYDNTSLDHITHTHTQPDTHIQK